MLTHLRIRDLIVVESATLEFSPGFNVLSGSTGAGKSVLLAALALVTGARAKNDWIRPGAEEAVVEAFFMLPEAAARRLRMLGFDCDDGELHLRRVIRADGRSQAFLQGFPHPVARLRELGDLLVERQAQHEQLSLVDPGRQLDLLDNFAGSAADLADYRGSLAALRELRGERDRLERELASLRNDEEYVRFQLDEIDALAPEPGEIEALETRERRLRNSTKIRETLREALSQLERGAEAIGEMERSFRRMERLDEERPEKAIVELDAAIGELREQLQPRAKEVAEDADRGERLGDRLSKLHALLRKHDCDLEGVLAWAKEQRELLAGLGQREARLGELGAGDRDATRALAAAAQRLSERRAAAAAALGGAWEEKLSLLGLEQCRLRYELTRRTDPAGLVELKEGRFRAGELGIDRVELRVRTNPDLPEGGLRDLPSGGELSRIALARHLLGIELEAPPLLVLDEVDAGLGADTARLLAGRLAALSELRQLILVTHQANLAAAAGRQFTIRKEYTGGVTRSLVEEVSGEARVMEIARMLGEEEPTAELRRLAESLLARGAAGGV